MGQLASYSPSSTRATRKFELARICQLDSTRLASAQHYQPHTLCKPLPQWIFGNYYQPYSASVGQHPVRPPPRPPPPTTTTLSPIMASALARLQRAHAHASFSMSAPSTRALAYLPSHRHAMMSALSHDRRSPLPQSTASSTASTSSSPLLGETPPVVVPSSKPPSGKDLSPNAASPQVAARPPPAPKAERPRPKIRAAKAAITLVSFPST